MRKLTFLFLLAAMGVSAQTWQENPDAQEISALLKAQEVAWNNYDLNAFMETYWKSDELIFYGSSGVTKGWQATLERYQKSYPTEAHFGQLKLTFNEIAPINDGAYSVFGEFYLTRTIGDAKGIFMLVVKNIDGKWKIIADTSSTVD